MLRTCWLCDTTRRGTARLAQGEIHSPWDVDKHGYISGITATHGAANPTTVFSLQQEQNLEGFVTKKIGATEARRGGTAPVW